MLQSFRAGSVNEVPTNVPSSSAGPHTLSSQFHDEIDEEIFTRDSPPPYTMPLLLESVESINVPMAPYSVPLDDGGEFFYFRTLFYAVSFLSKKLIQQL